MMATRKKVTARKKGEHEEVDEKIKDMIDRERRLNQAYAITFTSSHGAAVLDDLRKETVNKVYNSSASDAELRHQEGKRELFALINSRIIKGKENAA